MNIQDENPGTFHLKLNASVTRDYEDIEYLIKEWNRDPQMNHPLLNPARKLLIITVKSFLPRQKETIKNSLEELYEKYPENINALANLSDLYNSLLLTKKSEHLQTRLANLMYDNTDKGLVNRARALAERGFVLISDIASQEIADDTDKLKETIKWFRQAIEVGRNNGMNHEELLLWTFYLGKSRFRLENRYRGVHTEDNIDARKENLKDMLQCFGEVYYCNKKDLDVHRAMSLVYPAEIFSSSRDIPALPELYLKCPEMQRYHAMPSEGCMQAKLVYDCYAVRNRIARVLMNQRHFECALAEVKASLMLNDDTNWFAFSTRLQIYKNWYLSLRKKQVCKNMLKEALEGIDKCPYRSASTLLDIADIHYYIGVDPVTEEPEEPAELERAIEYVMLARERVEGYMNARTHARLAHLLWALASHRPAIECMKRAVELESKGYTKNIQMLCKYLCIKYRDSVDHGPATETNELAIEAACCLRDYRKRKRIEDKETFKKHLSSLDDSQQDTLKEMLKRIHAEELYKDLFDDNITVAPDEQLVAVQKTKTYTWSRPDNCHSLGFQYDFLILSSEADFEFALDILYELEGRQCEGYRTYKGFFPDRDVETGESIFYAFERALAESKILIVIISFKFHRDYACRLLLDEMLFTGPCSRSYGIRNGGQRIVPIVMGECQLPFGLISAGFRILCGPESKLPPQDMNRLRRLLDKSSEFAVKTARSQNDSL